MSAVAAMEFNGVPINTERLGQMPLFTGSDNPEDWERLVRILVEATA